jgi:hypothetical protein
MDWTLIDVWKEAGIPLEAVLRGIDAAFDKYDQRPSKTQKINSLAYCSQAVLSAAEDMREAAVGSGVETADKSRGNEGFEPGAIALYLSQNAGLLEAAKVPFGSSLQVIIREIAAALARLSEETKQKPVAKLEDLERRLSVLEEKLLAALITSTTDDEMVVIRAQADRELTPYRRKMPGPQIEQLQKQYVQKKLLEKFRLPRLSLFYM